jgi:hypothetical protein
MLLGRLEEAHGRGCGRTCGRGRAWPARAAPVELGAGECRAWKGGVDGMRHRGQDKDQGKEVGWNFPQPHGAD